MTAATFVLQRYTDPSGVSGTGVVAEGAEFSDGLVVLRWHGETPSTAVWGDIRHVERIHGHEGQTVVEYSDPERLVKAYQRITRLLLEGHPCPATCGPHPDHPDRLRLTFRNELTWEYWIARLGGSPDAAVHVDFPGEAEHRWVSPDGLLWLSYYTPEEPK